MGVNDMDIVEGFSESIKHPYSNITLKINIYKNGGVCM